MNNVRNKKYGLSPEEIFKKSLSGERLKTVFNMHRIEKTKLLHDRLKIYVIRNILEKRKN